MLNVASNSHWDLIVFDECHKLSAYDYKGWAVLEWECAIKDAATGAAEGAPFIKQHIIKVTEKAFDDFAGTGSDENFNRRILGID